MWRALLITALLPLPSLAQDFFTLKGHGGPIMDIAVSPSGQIATASFDNAIGLWAGRKPTWLDGHEAAVNTVTFMHDDIIVSAGDDFAVRLWSRTGAQTELGHHKGKVTALATCRGAQDLIASASWDGTLAVWQMETSPEDMLAKTSPPPKPAALEGHTNGVNDVAFSDDCTTLYSASSDGTVRLWDVAAAQETAQLVKHGFGVNELVVNEADGWLAYGAVDGGTRMIDLATGESLADFTLGRRPILALAHDADTGQLAVGDGEGYIMVIDTQSRRITRDFRAAQNGPVWALAFSNGGQNIHAGGIEDVLYSWPVVTLTEHGQMSDAKRSFLEDPDTLPNGERQFKRKCSVCHTLEPGSARRAGPSLYALFGRPAGRVSDYPYSATLLRSTIIWSDQTINALFDEGPDHYIPGTKMPMQRITAPQDRKDLIDYLKVATRP